MPPTTCVITDEHPAVLEAVSAYLERHGIEIAGRARDGAEALAMIEEKQPRVARVDLLMPKVGGIEVAREAARSAPDTGVIL